MIYFTKEFYFLIINANFRLMLFLVHIAFNTITKSAILHLTIYHNLLFVYFFT